MIVVLNTCVIDAGFLNEIPGIEGAVPMGQAGNESGNALADVLTGKVNPGGRLTDTWAKRYEDNPASETFGANDGDTLQEDYREDIFVGYRYFDTFGIEPLYPFGYGLSCTSFRKECGKVTADWRQVSVAVEVTNTGSTPGRDVVQIYVTAPEGCLTKPFQEMKGFCKTELLQPGESRTVTVNIPTESLASFDTQQAAFVMEPGDYLLRMGSHSRETQVVRVLRLDRADVQVCACRVLEQIMNSVSCAVLFEKGGAAPPFLNRKFRYGSAGLPAVCPGNRKLFIFWLFRRKKCVTLFMSDTLSIAESLSRGRSV